MTYDPDARLDTGMKVREAIARAAHWWDKQGRHLTSEASTDIALRGVSGIAAGAPWEALERYERLQVVKVWHHFFIRRPDKLGVEPDVPFRLGHQTELH